MKINVYIDHTLLKPEASQEQIKRVCEEAIEHEFASVCVNPCHVSLVYKKLNGTAVKTCAVIGFPLGANTTESKIFEARQVIENGAQEIDMVMNIGALKDRQFALVEKDIAEILKVAKGKALVKVILECCLLTDDEKVKACEIAKQAGANFVKTSTGFSTGGATIQDVKLMRRVVGDKVGVKASGGIRDYESAIAMINAGATRIGASSSVAIVKGNKNNIRHII
jgi:deoxyribose-phosphate aldolase